MKNMKNIIGEILNAILFLITFILMIILFWTLLYWVVKFIFRQDILEYIFKAAVFLAGKIDELVDNE